MTAYALAWPAGLALLALGAAIAWLHLRRMPGPTLTVPSLEPWSALLGAAARRRRRVPPGALLAMHLAICSLLALACAGPRRADVGGGRERVFLLDTTTSMAAGDRWRLALEALEDLLAGGGPYWLLAVGPRPATVASEVSDAGAVLRAAGELRPAGAGADWAGARLLAGIVAGETAEVHVITDGGDARPAEWTGLAGWWTVGRSEANVAVVEAQGRRVGGRSRLYARVVNFGPEAVTTRVRLLVDGIERDRRDVSLGAGRVHELVWSVPEGRWAEVRLDGGDVLPADDWAPVALGPVAIRAQLIGLSDAVERVVRAIDGLEPRHAGRGDYRLDGSVDVTVVEGEPLDALPPGGCVVFASGSGGEDARAGRPVRIEPVADHPLGRGLDFAGATVRSSSAGLAVPVWARPVLEAEDRVLAYAGTAAGTRVVVFGLDAGSGDIAQRVAFPVLVARAVVWAAGFPRAQAMVAGDLLDLGGLPARVTGPELTAERPSGGRLQLGLPGRYEVARGLAGTGDTWTVGARAGHPTESDLAVAVADGDRLAPGTAGRWPAELGGWLAALALAVLAVEGVWRGSGARAGAAAGGRRG